MKKTDKFKIMSIALMLLLLVQLMLPIKSYAIDVPTKNYYYISDMDYITENKWSYVGWGEITYDLGYMKSSNIGVANLVTKYINKDDLDKYLKKLGFGSKTGIELPGEVSGQIKFKYDIEVATASFGQGITTTPIQHIKALSYKTDNVYIDKNT